MSRRIGILLVIISAAAFGTLAILGRYAYAAGMDIYTMLFLRFSLAALLMGALLYARGERLPGGAVLGVLIGMGAVGYVGQAFCYLTALNYASAGLVALLLYLYPAFVALLSALVLGERLSRRKLLALGLALLGTALTVGPSGGQWQGALLAVGAAVIYSVYIIVGSRVMKQVSGEGPPVVQSSVVIFAAAGAVYGVLALFNGLHLPSSPAGWLVVAALVLVATVIPVAAFLAGLERIGPTSAAMYSTLEPVVTVLLAALLFGETLEALALLGGGLILAAVLLLTQAELHGPDVPAVSQTPAQF